MVTGKSMENGIHVRNFVVAEHNPEREFVKSLNLEEKITAQDLQQKQEIVIKLAVRRL